MQILVSDYSACSHGNATGELWRADTGADSGFAIETRYVDCTYTLVATR